MSTVAQSHTRLWEGLSRAWTPLKRTNWRYLIDLLVPQEERRDPQFKAQLERLSVIGLRVIAGVNIGVTLYFMAASLVLPRGYTEKIDSFLFSIAIVALGVVPLGLSFWSKSKPYARSMAMFVGYCVALIQFWNLRNFIETPEAGHFVLSRIVFGIMLVGIAALPIKPVHTLVLGGAITATFGALVQVPGVLPQLLSEHYDQIQVLTLVVLAEVVLLCAALTTVVYHQRVLAYRGRRAAQQAFEELRQAQVRVCVSETAASQSRFAAALSHELNTPLGSLASAFDTVVQVHQREQSHPELRAKLETVFEEATRAGRESTSRLRKTVEHMKHLTNLDRAEEQVTDLNELWKDTLALLSTELERKAEVETDLRSLPLVKCRPQQIGAVFSNLVRNAAAAMDQKGIIRVRSAQQDGEIVLEVRDNGHGMPPAQVQELFDPTLHVDSGRVSTTNWGLFICRSIITEHGGYMEIDSKEGVGTTARVLLPAPIHGDGECCESTSTDTTKQMEAGTRKT